MKTKVNVLLLSELAGGMAPHDDGEFQIEFHRIAPDRPLPRLAGTVWALVDWMLPEMSGLEACRRLRCNPAMAGARITMVLEGDDAEARRRAVSAGADDYLTGPIDRARIMTLMIERGLVAPARDPASIVSYNGLTVDLSAFQARWRGHPIPLMPIQLRLLRFLIERPGQIFTRSQLIEALGQQDAPLDERTVDVWIGRLRRALKSAGAGVPLRTVRSFGYVLDRAKPRLRPARTARWV